jgi:hypothetical protein
VSYLKAFSISQLELLLEPLKVLVRIIFVRNWPGRSYFYKIVYNYFPLYLVKLLPKLVNERCQRSYIPLRSGHNISQFKCRTEKFKKSLFPSTISLSGIVLILTLEIQLLFQILN